MAIGDPDSSDPLVLARDIGVNFNGGTGDDNAIIIIGGNVALDGRLTSVLNMGAGNDHVTLESAAPFLVDSFFDIIVDLADGNDFLSAKFSLPDAREMQVAGKLQLKALGGRGNDSLALDFTNVPLLDVTADLGMGSNVLSIGDLISLTGAGVPFDPGHPIVALKKNGNLERLPPIQTFSSVVDSTVRVPSLVTHLYDQLQPNGHELVLFDVNRFSALGPFVKDHHNAFLDKLKGTAALPYAWTLITNQTPDTLKIAAVTRVTDSDVITHEPLDVEWPKGIYSLSHVAVPFSPEDRLYGEREEFEKERIFRFGNG